MYLLFINNEYEVKLNEMRERERIIKQDIYIYIYITDLDYMFCNSFLQ